MRQSTTKAKVPAIMTKTTERTLNTLNYWTYVRYVRFHGMATKRGTRANNFIQLFAQLP
jgi:hypothetical protein